MGVPRTPFRNFSEKRPGIAPMGVRLRSSQLNGMLREQASPLMFTIQWEPNGDRRSVTVPSTPSTRTIGYLAGLIVRNKLFVEDEPPAARRGVLFRCVTMLDEKKQHCRASMLS